MKVMEEKSLTRNFDLGKKIFTEIQSELLKHHPPYYFVAICVETGKYVIDKSLDKAIKKAHKKFPGQQVYYRSLGDKAVCDLPSPYPKEAWEE